MSGTDWNSFVDDARKERAENTEAAVRALVPEIFDALEEARRGERPIEVVQTMARVARGEVASNNGVQPAQLPSGSPAAPQGLPSGAAQPVDPQTDLEGGKQYMVRHPALPVGERALLGRLWGSGPRKLAVDDAGNITAWDDDRRKMAEQERKLDEARKAYDELAELLAGLSLAEGRLMAADGSISDVPSGSLVISPDERRKIQTAVNGFKGALTRRETGS